MKIALDISIKFIRLIFSLSLMIWIFGIFIPVINNKYSYLTFFSEQFYSTVCHQVHHKSFNFDDAFLNVCVRCLGIYSGALITSLIILFTRRAFRLNLIPLIIFSSPMFIDVLFLRISLYEYSKAAALITGMVFGSIVFIYILSVIENSFSEKIKGK